MRTRNILQPSYLDHSDTLGLLSHLVLDFGGIVIKGLPRAQEVQRYNCAHSEYALVSRHHVTDDSGADRMGHSGKGGYSRKKQVKSKDS